MNNFRLSKNAENFWFTCGSLARTLCSLAQVPEFNRCALYQTAYGDQYAQNQSLAALLRISGRISYSQATSTVLKARLIEVLLKASPDLEVPVSIVRQEAAGMVAQILQAQGQQVEPEQMESPVSPRRRPWLQSKPVRDRVIVSLIRSRPL